jgi:hypothetical protein
MTTNFITSCGKCGRDISSLGPPLIWSDQHGHICYGCHTDNSPMEKGIFPEQTEMIGVVLQGGQNSKICGERKGILAATRCEMMDPRHPDDPGPDRYCSEGAIGRTEEYLEVWQRDSAEGEESVRKTQLMQTPAHARYEYVDNVPAEVYDEDPEVKAATIAMDYIVSHFSFSFYRFKKIA